MSTIEELYGEDEVFTRENAADALFAIGKIPTAVDIATFWKDKKKEPDETISREELIELSNTLKDGEDALREAFKVFDKDGNNKITKDELKTFLQAADVYGGGMGDEDGMIDQIFKDANIDTTDEEGEEGANNAGLDVDEFIRMITKKIFNTELLAD
ncbi:calmodulin-beta-like [Mercenaria mercenaria]|uniref:calmodulin-beta-like n=1 Tax=Mercenaria mercenaria TaxID=6596 RepID=UPI001E1E19FA|nr:calmodulin-beta-like [Mercenaria mercenaria]